ncbi:unnamed protein product [Phaedon cochleariae]|uniref:Cytochrome-b5 reductase n=1 Tax=Phaedon cochleariae TaxID=80249 RepID=A0A9P0DFL7_PHACE|nr:unnamed protein product [Phaedon cochleariae]
MSMFCRNIHNNYNLLKMNSNKSPSKHAKSSIGNLLGEKYQNKPQTLVPPVLQQVGKLAAGVASVSTNFDIKSGSATGNPRNKCALQPGHSLMDWIRLGASGKDLSGVGSCAGKLSVTLEELSKHNKITDIWLAIRGIIYNVTAYVPFHPGGADELMRAAGIDATSLFEQVHPWVNYEQILQKCLIGRLVSIDPSINTNDLFFGKKGNGQITKNNLKAAKQTRIEETEDTLDKSSSTQVAASSSAVVEEVTFHSEVKSVINQIIEDIPSLPRFDWIQKLDYITIIFYTRSFSNPMVEIFPPTPGQSIIVVLAYDSTAFRNELVFYEAIEWPCTTKVTCETGKVELVFRKRDTRIWANFGVLRQMSKRLDTVKCFKCNFVYRDKLQLNHNLFLLRLERTDGAKIVMPIGQHSRFTVNIDGQEWSRSYTPIPSSLFSQLATHLPTTDSVCLMIKRYDDGNVSRYLTDRQINDVVYLTGPLGEFDIGTVEERNGFLMLAAGTGVTPMLGLLVFLLERRIRKCQFLRLLFFNRTLQDIPFRAQLDTLERSDSRLKIDYILSEPNDDWTGLSGHVNEGMIQNSITDHIKDTGYTMRDVFTFICGPKNFVTLSLEELEKLNFSDDQLFAFQG